MLARLIRHGRGGWPSHLGPGECIEGEHRLLVQHSIKENCRELSLLPDQLLTAAGHPLEHFLAETSLFHPFLSMPLEPIFLEGST